MPTLDTTNPSIIVPQHADIGAICAAAGNAAWDASYGVDLLDGTLRIYVSGVTQEALDKALIEVGTEPSAKVPASVSKASFLREAAHAGIITQAEALAAAKTGDVPVSFEPLLAALPAKQAFEARLAFAASAVIERTSPLLALIVGPQGIPAKMMDDLFRAAGV